MLSDESIVVVVDSRSSHSGSTLCSQNAEMNDTASTLESPTLISSTHDVPPPQQHISPDEPRPVSINSIVRLDREDFLSDLSELLVAASGTTAPPAPLPLLSHVFALPRWLWQRTVNTIHLLFDNSLHRTHSIYRHFYQYQLQLTAQWFIYRHRLQSLLIDTRTRLMITLTDGQEPEQYRRRQLEMQRNRIFGKHLMPDKTLNQFYSSLRDPPLLTPSPSLNSPGEYSGTMGASSSTPAGITGSSGGACGGNSSTPLNHSIGFFSHPSWAVFSAAYRLERFRCDSLQDNNDGDEGDDNSSSKTAHYNHVYDEDDDDNNDNTATIAPIATTDSDK